MPNFWTKATQFVDESINGPRTKDEEFSTKIKKLKEIEKGMEILTTLIKDFSKNTEQFKTFNSKLAESINYIIQDEHTVTFINEIMSKYKYFLDYYNKFVMEICVLNNYISSWQEEIKNIHKQIDKRDDKRKIYDHYDEKLEKIKKSSKKDSNYLQRNVDKFTTAKNDFNAASKEANKLIDSFFNNRFNLVKPVLSQFFKAESSFYINIYNEIIKHKNINLNLGNNIPECSRNNFNDDWFCNNNQQQNKKTQNNNHFEPLFGIIEGIPENRNRSHTNYQKNSHQHKQFKTFDYMNNNHQSNPLLFDDHSNQGHNENIKNQGCPPVISYQNYKDSVMNQYMTQDVNQNRRMGGKDSYLLDEDSFE
jgi:hypothetical protein